MAKLGQNKRVRSDFEQLFQLLHDGFIGEKLVSLRSIFHDAETSLSGHLKDSIKRRISTLSHVQLEHPLHIKERQIARAIAAAYENTESHTTICYDDPFHNDPDGPVPMFDIDVDTDWIYANEREDRSKLANKLDVVRRRIQHERTSFKEQYRVEEAWVRQNLCRRSNAVIYSTAACVSSDDYVVFMEDVNFECIPILYLEVALLARLMTANSNRAIDEGDVTDVDAMAAYLPYCDVYATDKRIASVARSLDAESKFQCRLFDSSKAGVADLIQHLDTLRLEHHFR